MKMCPNCKTINADEEHYCTECRYKLDNAEFIPNPKFSRGRSIGCLILIIIAVVAVVLAFVRPQLFMFPDKTEFGKGFLKMIPSHTATSSRY